MMTEDVILKCAGGPASLASVTYLNLHGNAIRKIEGLGACPNLKVLVLSFNELTKLEAGAYTHSFM